MAHVTPWKNEMLKDLVEMINKRSVIGLINIDGIPGPQMLQMRKGLWREVDVKVTKIRLIKRALEEAEKDHPGISKLADKLDGQCGLVATDINPFTLYQMMKKTITPSPAKGGDKAPDDIVIEAGDTPFKPGPIVGDFGKANIPAAIDKGKVVIKKTTTPCKEGEVISADLASMLTKLEIFPMKVGMNLNLVYEDGNLYQRKDLDIDVDQFRIDVSSAHQQAMNLAMFAAIVTPLTMKPLLQKAYQQSVALAVNAAIPTTASTEILLTKAYMHMLNLASQVSEDSLDDDLKGTVGAGAAAAPAAEPAAEDSGGEEEQAEEEEEEVSEEEAVSGLGALFG